MNTAKTDSLTAGAETITATLGRLHAQGCLLQSIVPGPRVWILKFARPATRAAEAKERHRLCAEAFLRGLDAAERAHQASRELTP